MRYKQTDRSSKPMPMATWLLGAVVAGAIPLALTPAPVWAQEDGGHEDGGHEDGGHEDGGHEDGGHEEGGGGNGQGGQGNGQGQHGKPKPVAPVILATGVGETSGLANGAVAGARGTYVRLELGAAQPGAGDASWLPSDYPAVPQVFFDIDADAAITGGIAVGRSFGNGWRLEGAFNVFGSADFSGPWSYTLPAEPGPHADVEGSVRSIALFANGYYDFAAVGRATPFVTAGLGVARNTMSDWTRINPDAGRTTRSFEGGSQTGVAWTLGAGVAADVGSVLGSPPAKLELAWRYYDLGSVTGGTTPLPGSGSGGSPVEALNFDVTDQVLSLGLRIPL